MSNDEQISKEWAVFYNRQLERHEKLITDSVKNCMDCREGLLKEIYEIRGRQREFATKILIGAVIIGLAADFAIRYMLK